MQPHRLAQLSHTLQNLQVGRLVQGAPQDIAENLYPRGVQGAEGALGLGHGCVRIVHRQGGDKTGKAIRVCLHHCGLGIVGQTGDLRCFFRPVDKLDGRRGEAGHLAITRKAVHYRKAGIQIHHDLQLRRPAQHVQAVAGALQRHLDKGLRQPVAKYIDRGAHNFQATARRCTVS